MLGARRQAPPTRSRSPGTNEAHRCPKRTEPFHPTHNGPRYPKRTEQIHPTNEAPAARGERNHSTLHTTAPATRSERNKSTLQTRPPLPEANGTIPQNTKTPRCQSQKKTAPPGPFFHIPAALTRNIQPLRNMRKINNTTMAPTTATRKL